MKDYYDVKFDVAAIFDHFGGVVGTSEMLRAAGMEIGQKVLQKQRERDRITAGVLASILIASIRMGKKFDLTNFLLEREK